MDDEIKNNLNRPIWEVDTLNRFITVTPLSLEGEIVGYSVRRDVEGSPLYKHNVPTLDIDGCDHWDWSLVGAVDKKINNLKEEIKSLQEWKESNTNNNSDEIFTNKESTTYCLKDNTHFAVSWEEDYNAFYFVCTHGSWGGYCDSYGYMTQSIIVPHTGHTLEGYRKGDKVFTPDMIKEKQ